MWWLLLSLVPIDVEALAKLVAASVLLQVAGIDVLGWATQLATDLGTQLLGSQLLNSLIFW